MLRCSNPSIQPEAALALALAAGREPAPAAPGHQNKTVSAVLHHLDLLKTPNDGLSNGKEKYLKQSQDY